ncbi:TetR/AcrR family transcriptional regulator [Pseudodesulfovibrio sp.]|uniref:TetR/AcrR family transcriptional regulator n=1 Tax=Pseudodesulfovibrio sp. TaxID=2035812 RepID=UPI0026362CB7|nr:TetR/AcrR family transcriptional regulator [Pseudodesulfovibrio sp.]MDD3312498.1 TetR family transcriptional regulator C-terminal domain-containing protein [Pseudodesulfovibrio sp.]
MSEDTRQRILEVGAELIHQRGFNNTGLKDILEAAGVPKGSFYFYFANKEAFGIEMVDYLSQRFGEMVGPIVQDESVAPLERLRRFFMAFHAYFEAHGFTRGCPIGNLGQEMGDLSAPFREKLTRSLDGLAGVVADLLAKAQRAGDVEPDLEIRETAIFIIEAWHGAIIRMKVTKTPEPLEIFYKLIFDNVLR